VLALALSVAAAGCSKGPSKASPSTVPSVSVTPRAQQLARTFTDAVVQGAPERLTAQQATCLTDQVASHIDEQQLSSIASQQPNPRTLDPTAKEAFVEAFDRCLPSDLAAALRQRLG